MAKREREPSNRYTDEFIFGEAMKRMRSWPAEKQRAWLWAINIVAEMSGMATAESAEDSEQQPLLEGGAQTQTE